MNGAGFAGRLLSVNVGMPRTIDWNGRRVHTGIGKWPVDGPVAARRLNLDGDGQGDTAGHGGEQRAILVYQAESYRYWERLLSRGRLDPGLLGENLTVTGLADDDVCIGDRYRVGEAIVEATQPRVTCFRAGIRIGVPQMASLLVAHHRPGFYLRVITEGTIRAGQPIERIERGRHGLSVSEVDALLYLPDPDREQLRKAVEIDALSPGWRESFEQMLLADATDAADQRLATGIEPSAADATGWSGFRELTVVGLLRETPTVLSIRLAAPDGATLPTARAGQFLTVRLPDSGDQAVRSYSLSSLAEDGSDYRISVRRGDHGAASSWLQNNLALGATLDVARPRGDFVLDPSEHGPVVLLSGGIGATPVLAMLQELAATDPTREVWWIQSSRDAGDLVFADESTELLDQLPHSHRVIYYSRGADRPADVASNGRVGRITVDALRQLGLPLDASAYMCGPTSFIDDMLVALTTIGLDPAKLHSELFGTLAAINPGVVAAPIFTPHRPEGPPGDGPTVTFTRSGLTVPWAAERYASLLELAEACDIPTRWSCRSGVCHTCITPLVSGGTRYVSPPLTEPGGDDILLCCSEPAGEIILDA